MSWYKSTELTERERNYLKSIQTIFKVQDARRKWISLKLTPHQIEWHKDDIAIQGADAVNRVVYKSRNTSFTTDALLSNLMAVGSFGDQIIPFVRLNQTRANDLIGDCKKLVKNMNGPIQLKDGRFYPFDPDMVDMKAKGSIFFADRGVEFRAFPATASASEIIRGLRIAGSAGIVDEGNYMRDFENIYIALRDAAAGFDEFNKKYFQINIGTTLKGNTTPFKLWLDKQLKLKIKSMKIYHWPVFDPNLFNPDISPLLQNLVPIVPWHNINDLYDKWKENLNRFLEEYMGVSVDSDESLYAQGLILRMIDTELINYKAPPHPGIFFLGIDVGAINDFFSMSIFELLDNNYIQRHLFWKQGCELDEMEDLCRTYINLWKPTKTRIDAKGMGFQLGQTLNKEFGSSVEAIRTTAVGGLKKTEKIPFSEFIHTNQLWLMNQSRIRLLNDEMQIIHYGMWDRNYKAPSTKEYGHADITISNGMSVLPANWRYFKGFTQIKTNMENDMRDEIKSMKDSIEHFNRMSIKDRMKFYKRGRGR